MPVLQQTLPRTPMKRTAHKISQDDGQQLLFSARPTIADRTATGELIDVSKTPTASGFRWPLTVSAALHRDVQTIPRGSGRAEVVSLRWKHVLTLITPTAAQIIRDRLEKLQVNVVLRTTSAPERSREHIKHLCLSMERGPDDQETFALGYCAEK